MSDAKYDSISALEKFLTSFVT